MRRVVSTMRIIAILVGCGILFALDYGLSAPWFVSLPLALIGYFVTRYGRDVRQNSSWKLGYERGKAGSPWREGPWWSDRLVYAAGFSHGGLARRDAAT